MAQAKHIGRVVFRHPWRRPASLPSRCAADATYLVTGGLRGLGLLAAQWLADEGRAPPAAGRPQHAGRRAEAASNAIAAAGVAACTVARAPTSAAPAGVDSLMARLAQGLPAAGAA